MRRMSSRIRGPRKRIGELSHLHGGPVRAERPQNVRAVPRRVRLRKRRRCVVQAVQSGRRSGARRWIVGLRPVSVRHVSVRQRNIVSDVSQRNPRFGDHYCCVCAAAVLAACRGIVAGTPPTPRDPIAPPGADIRAASLGKAQGAAREECAGRRSTRRRAE